MVEIELVWFACREQQAGMSALRRSCTAPGLAGLSRSMEVSAGMVTMHCAFCCFSRSLNGRTRVTTTTLSFELIDSHERQYMALRRHGCIGQGERVHCSNSAEQRLLNTLTMLVRMQCEDQLQWPSFGCTLF